MRSYRFDFVSGDRIVQSTEHEFVDDVDALDAAERLSQDFDVCIWRERTLVANVKKGNRLSTVADGRAG